MTKPISLTPRVRTAAASCLGLTPTSSAQDLRSAVINHLDVDTPEAVFDLAPTDLDPIHDRKIAAAQLLLTPVDDRSHMRRTVAFSAADSKVPEDRKVLQIRQTAQPVAEQLAFIA